jgi:hypothetical protein
LPVIDLWFDVVVIRGKAVIAFSSMPIVVPTARCSRRHNHRRHNHRRFG